MRVGIVVLLVVAGLTRIGFGQPAATAPATAPARYEMTMPAGYEKVAVGGHVAICKPADLEWVKKGLADVKPATRPTTMPVDVIKKTTAGRAEVVKQMAADLGLTDEKETNQLFDEKILPALKKMDELKPPVFFLAVTREQLRDLCREGWGEPRFHYNRLAGEVSHMDNVMLSIERPMDDTVLPYFYEEKDTAEARSKNMAIGIQNLDWELSKLISDQSQPAVFNALAQHIGGKCFEVGKLQRDQQWLALGVTDYFAAKYAGLLTLAPREQWLKVMTYEDSRYPVSSGPIDLSKPLAQSAMKPIAVPYYDQAMRRKAVRVVMKWAEKNGEASVTKALLGVRGKTAANGAELVKMIAEACGVDLSKELGPG